MAIDVVVERENCELPHNKKVELIDSHPELTDDTCAEFLVPDYYYRPIFQTCNRLFYIINVSCDVLWRFLDFRNERTVLNWTKHNLSSCMKSDYKVQRLYKESVCASASKEPTEGQTLVPCHLPSSTGDKRHSGSSQMFQTPNMPTHLEVRLRQ